MACGRKSLTGIVYKKKLWAKRWAKGRPVRKVKGGWKIGKGRKKK